MKLKKLFLTLATLGLGVSALNGCSFLDIGSNGFTVYWMSHNGNNDELLQLDEHVKKGTVVEYRGKTPTRPDHDYHTYTFSHWDPEPGPITKDTTYRAVYDIKRITFKITWKNWDDSIIAVDEVEATYLPEYNHPTPTKENTAQYKYTFKGWDKDIVPAIKDMEYKAQFEESINSYTVNFKNYDGEVLQTSTLRYGSTPAYTGATPQREGEGAFSYYAFTGWTPEIGPVVEDVDYIATFKTYEDDTSMFNFVENDDDGYTVTGFSDTELFKQLKYISIPSEYNNKPVNKIADYAFDASASYETFTQVEIPTSVTHIGNGAFRGCSAVTSFSLPATLTYIGALAFAGCSALTELPIPSSVTYIGSSIFQSCNAFETLEVPFVGSTINECTSIGYFFGTSSTYNLPIHLTTIKINEPCTELASNVLLGKKFDRVYVPNTVTKFNGSISAQYLYFGGILRQWTAIDMSAVNNIDKFYARSGSSYNLQTNVMITGATEIGPYVLSGIKSLKGVSVASGHNAIPNHFLDGCTGITSFSLAVGATTIGDYAFNGCTGLATFTLASSSQLTTIGEGAFKGCTKLGSFAFPNKLTTIGKDAFYGCSSLTSVTLSDTVTSLGEQAFAYCNKIQTATIGAGITSLNKTFWYCTGLKSVTAPNVTELIGAFNYCYLLETVNVDSLETYDDDTFYGCSSLLAINVSDTSAYTNDEGDGILYNKEKTKIVYFPKGITDHYTMPNTITEIGEKAFKDSALTSITLSSNLTKIGRYAFDGAFITSISIPSSVTRIEDYAFRNTKLTSIIVPSTVEYIGVSVFYGCNDLTEMRLPYIGNSMTSGKRFINIFGTFPNKLEKVTFLEGMTSIDSDAFAATNSLKEIIIPNSVTSIAKGAFSGCKSINTITLPFVGGSDADDNAFGYIFGADDYNQQDNYVPKSLKIVKLSSAATRIPESAFDFMRYINEMYVGDNITVIGAHAFETCYSLTYILLGTNLSSIGSSAFLNCHNLVEVGNKSSLEIAKGSSNFGYIAYRADYVVTSESMFRLSKHDTGFYVLQVQESGSSALVQYCISYGGNNTSVNLPAVKYVGTFMLYWHKEITSVSIPSTIQAIGSSAFGYCTSLTTITYAGSKSSWNAMTKGSNWNQNVPAKVVVCSDGEVSI